MRDSKKVKKRIFDKKGKHWWKQTSIYNENAQLGYRGNKAQHKKDIWQAPHIASYSTMKDWKSFLWDQEQDKDAHSCRLFSIVLEILAIAIRPQEEMRHANHEGRNKNNFIYWWCNYIYIYIYTYIYIYIHILKYSVKPRGLHKETELFNSVKLEDTRSIYKNLMLLGWKNEYC